MKRWVLLGAVLTTGLSGAALGAAPAEPPKDEVRKLNFEGDTISTDYLKPGALLIEGLRRGRRSTLIEVRLDFVAEILRSAEDI
ncbi:MAG: hypothetical protein KC635_17420 [Myxococcales bacterium]|nr:hypothetical protein [Myxococcales bacterium]MCB9733039.1 hypothetical protein [Deltaproteobacteria bacterium]